MMKGNERLKGALREGEELKWSGSPKDISVLGTASKGKIMLLWIVAAAWIAASLLYCMPKMIETGDTGAHMIIVMLLIDCIPLLMISMPFADRRILGQETIYAITNCRVMVLYKERTISMPLDQARNAEVRMRGNNLGSILIGDAAGKSESSLRSIALKGIDRKNTITGMVLYHVDDPQKVLGILKNSQGGRKQSSSLNTGAASGQIPAAS